MLGAGFGGLELTTKLSEEFGDGVEIVLIDQNDAFVFGFSKLDVMFGRALPAAVRHPYRDMVKPGVRFVQTVVRSIDPIAKRVETDAGAFESDLLSSRSARIWIWPPRQASWRPVRTSTASTARWLRAMHSPVLRAVA